MQSKFQLANVYFSAVHRKGRLRGAFLGKGSKEVPSVLFVEVEGELFKWLGRGTNFFTVVEWEALLFRVLNPVVDVPRT